MTEDRRMTLLYLLLGLLVFVLLCALVEGIDRV